ncbi:MAG: hypothetical protein LBR31_03450 [Desulfovibrio sp.]|jgi:tetratricopeptide (TPR) repeat protein|nr:hypothetical protein [Desulfovibrio sp.]
MMTEKIEWYREVLEIEPNSKVFFPLARLLKAENRRDEAIEILEHGLERHPEYLEARLFLIELLHGAGRNTACADQLNKITALFSAHTEFWLAWAACSSGEASRDMGLVLRFVAAHFMNSSLSLSDVIDKGLRDILGQGETAAVSARPDGVPAQKPQDVPPAFPEGQPASPALDAKPEAREDAQPEHADDDADAVPTGMDEPGIASSDDGEERFSLRTRSMAEILAEQGDIKGALDIYQELAAASTDPAERSDLLQRVTTLNAKLSAAPETPVEQTAQGAEPAVGKDKLISMLEALAERVEARAQG